MKSFTERLERIEVEQEVHIPTLDGHGIAQTIKVKVPALRDPKDGEIYFDAEALALLDKAKARHMGLLSPAEIKHLRRRLGLTQAEISDLLQIGEKTWTRWETGRERPSRALNVLLCAVRDGQISLPWLRRLAARRHIGPQNVPAFSGPDAWRQVVRRLCEHLEAAAAHDWSVLAQPLATTVGSAVQPMLPALREQAPPAHPPLRIRSPVAGKLIHFRPSAESEDATEFDAPKSESFHRLLAA